jgi:hypothetical protein
MGGVEGRDVDPPRLLLWPVVDVDATLLLFRLLLMLFGEGVGGGAIGGVARPLFEERLLLLLFSSGEELGGSVVDLRRIDAQDIFLLWLLLYEKKLEKKNLKNKNKNNKVEKSN